MAAEIEFTHTTGRTCYAQVRNSVGQIWNTAGSAFEAYLTANIADYDIAATEQGTASGFYTANMPAAVAGVYNVIAKDRAGGSPAEGDTTIGEGVIEWAGTTVGLSLAAKDNTDYPDGCVIWDSVRGGAGTTVGINGTVRNPANSFDNATTIANSLNTSRIRLTGSYGGETISSGGFFGWDIDINGSLLKIADAVSLGTVVFKSTNGKGTLLRDDSGRVSLEAAYVENMRLNGARIGLNNSYTYFRNCEFYGNITIAGWDGTNPLFFSDCYNSLSDTPIEFDFGSTAAVDVVLQGWYGDLKIVSLAAGQVVECYGYGKLTIAASCTGGTIKHTSHIEILDQAGGAVTTELISEPGTLTSAYDLYHADIQFTVDEANTKDEYTLTWFKNGIRQTSGITVPTLQVVKRSDGTDLIASTTPTQIAATGSYKYDEATNRITAGEAALAIVTATIDGSTRTFSRLLSRDSEAP